MEKLERPELGCIDADRSEQCRIFSYSRSTVVLVAGDASGCRCEKNGPLSASFARLPIWQYSQTLGSLESNITFRGALKSLEKRRQMQTSRLKKIFDLNSSKICKMLADIFAKVADFSNNLFSKILSLER